MNKYNWEEVNFPSGKGDWKKLRIIIQQLLLTFFILKKIKIYPPYISKHNPNYQKQVILLMIPNGEKWIYLTVKNDHH